MKRLLPLLFLAMPLQGQVSVGGGTVSMTNVTVNVAAGTTTPLDWTSSMTAVWLLDETSGNRSAEAGTDCVADCTLTDNNTVTSSSDAIEGSYSAVFEATDNEYLRCAAATCDELLTVVNGTSVSAGLWIKRTDTCASTGSQACDTISMSDTATGNNGLRMYTNSGAATWSCKIGNTAEISGSSAADDEWVHLACVWVDDADDEIVPYTNGASDCSSGCSTQTTPGTATAGPSLSFSIASFDFDGQMDEVWITEIELTEAEIARIGACGVDGTSGPCECTGASWSNKGRVDANCTGDGTPYACCTASGTGCIDDALLTDACNAAAP